MMREAVQDFAEAMEKKLAEKDEAYGDSWKTCDINFLHSRLMREVEEFEEDYHGVMVFHEDEETTKELVDVANVCMMLYHRIREERLRQQPAQYSKEQWDAFWERNYELTHAHLRKPSQEGE